MRSVRKTLVWVVLTVAAVTALIYIADDLWARSHGRPVEQMEVDSYYVAMNHWNQLEYSIGKPTMQTCIDALLPHFGYVPCWYLRRHTLQRVKTY